jgi:hypothetical protein
MTRARLHTTAALLSLASALLITALPAVVPPLLAAAGPRGDAYDKDAARRLDLAGLDAAAFEAAWAMVLYVEATQAAVAESRGVLRVAPLREATDASGAPRLDGVRLELDAPQSTYPPAMYCAQCETQRCFFEDQGLRQLAALVSPERMRELAVKARGAGVSLAASFVGGADAGQIPPSRREPACRGGARESGRRSGSYRIYAGECGSEPLACTVGRGEAPVALRDGLAIDTNPLLACMRARCLYAASELYRADDFVVDLELRAYVVLDKDRSRRTARVELALVLGEDAVPAPSLVERLSRVLLRRGADLSS